MFESSRLSYIVPGYTGHIPGQQFRESKEIGQLIEQEQNLPHYQIPGYEGYIPSVKSENMFGKSYGKLTYSISEGSYSKGQDIGKAKTFLSLAQQTFVNQRQVKQRSAAEIVGVQPKESRYQFGIPQGQVNNFFGVPNQQDLLNTTQEFQNTVQTLKQTRESWKKENFIDMENLQEPVKHGQPLPGYTGYIQRVMPQNIFGQTFAASIKSSQEDMKIREHQQNKNVDEQQNKAISFQR